MSDCPNCEILRAALQRAVDECYARGEELIAIKADLKACAEALTTALLPLEALAASVKWELAPEVMDEIHNAITDGRAALARPSVQEILRG